MPKVLTSFNNGNMEIAIDKHSNMLIIGKAATKYSYKLFLMKIIIMMFYKNMVILI